MIYAKIHLFLVNIIQVFLQTIFSNLKDQLSIIGNPGFGLNLIHGCFEIAQLANQRSFHLG